MKLSWILTIIIGALLALAGMFYLYIDSIDTSVPYPESVINNDIEQWFLDEDEKFIAVQKTEEWVIASNSEEADEKIRNEYADDYSRRLIEAIKAYDGKMIFHDGETIWNGMHLREAVEFEDLFKYIELNPEKYRDDFYMILEKWTTGIQITLSMKVYWIEKYRTLYNDDVYFTGLKKEYLESIRTTHEDYSVCCEYPQLLFAQTMGYDNYSWMDKFYIWRLRSWDLRKYDTALADIEKLAVNNQWPEFKLAVMNLEQVIGDDPIFWYIKEAVAKHIHLLDEIAKVCPKEYEQQFEMTSNESSEIQVDPIPVEELKEIILPKKLDFTVAKVGRSHPFLIDHSRKLEVRCNGELVKEMGLYGDSGSGTTTILYEHDNGSYTLIDCCGQWYTFTFTDSLLFTSEWNWQQDLPDGPVVKFILDKKPMKYNKVMADSVEKDYIYLWKDPQN